MAQITRNKSASRRSSVASVQEQPDVARRVSTRKLSLKSTLGNKVKIQQDQVELQLKLLREEEETPTNDDGFLIKQLMLNLFQAVKTRDRRLEDRVRRNSSVPGSASTPSSPSGGALRSSAGDGFAPAGAHGTCAYKLLKCINKVMQTTAARRNQEKLQDFVVDWLMRPPEKAQPKIIKLEKFVGSRKTYWDVYHASTQKWQGRHAVPSESLPRHLKDMCGKSGSVLNLASAESASHYAKTGIAPARKDMDVATSIKKLHRKKPEVMRTRFGAFHNDTESVASEMSELDDFATMSAKTKLKRGQTMLQDSVGPSIMCPPSRAPQLLEKLPEWRDFNIPRRSRHRAIVAGAEDPSAHGDACTCGLCKHKSRLMLDIGQGIQRRVYGKPVTSLTGGDDLDELLRKSRTKPMPKCGSLPVLPTAGPNLDGTSKATLDPVDPPYARLPAMRDAFSCDDTVPMVQSGIWRYMQECQRLHTLPKVMRMLLDEALDGRSAAEIAEGCLFLSLADQGLTDADLDPICEAAIRLGNTVNGLDLSGNGFSDNAVAYFMERLPSRKLNLIDISNCGGRHRAVASSCKLLEDGGWPCVKVLRLRGCKIGTDKQWGELMHAILEQGNISELCLAETQLGYASQRSVAMVAGLVTQSEYLESLDISGNFLYYDGFEHMSGCILSCKHLKVLDVSHNAAFHHKMPRRLRPVRDEEDPTKLSDATVEDGGVLWEDLPSFNPVALLCEALVDNTTLQELRLSCSCVDYTADCCLLTSLVYNKTLKYLDISYNPHGDAGLRAIFRLLMLNDSLTRIDASHFDDAALGPELVNTDLGSPHGNFDLELSHPQHRAVLRWLLYRAMTNGIKPPQNAFEVSGWSKGDGVDWHWKKKNGRGWDCPRCGALQFEFEIPVKIEEQKSATDAIATWQEARRMQIPLAKFVPLFVLYDDLATWSQRESFIVALGQTLLLKVAQLLKFIKATPKHATEIARHLYGNVKDSDPVLFFDLVNHKNMAKMFRVEARGRFGFNAANPTNAYSIQLDKPLDRALAEQLRVVNYYEKARSERLQCSDVSRHGNHEGARNLTWELQPYPSLQDFEIEAVFSGRLKFDYASPPCCAASSKDRISTDVFVSDIIDCLQGSTAGQTDKVRALRFIAHDLVLTPSQVHRFCQLFQNPATKRPARLLWARARAVMKQTTMADIALGFKRLQLSAFSEEFDNPRAEVFVCLFNRCPDWHLLISPECLYDAGLFTLNCAKGIGQRLGILRTFDALRCDQPWRFCSVVSERLRAQPKIGGQRSSGKSGGLLAAPDNAAGRRVSGTRQSIVGVDATKGASKAARDKQLQLLREVIKNGMDEEKASWEMEPGRRYTFQLSVFEERRCLHLLCVLNTKEEGESLVRCYWSERERQMEEGYDFMIPSEWQEEGPAEEGTFKCTYMSEDDKAVKKKARRELAERFCGWPAQ